MSAATSSALSAARHYATVWRTPVVPNWWRNPDGSCGCQKPACDSPGKHPIVAAWPTAATTDEATITSWWKRWPMCRVGLLTGGELAIIDVDPRSGGLESLAKLEAKFGPLPMGPRARTAGGGFHAYFRKPKDLVLTSKSKAFGEQYPGVDTRGEGGQVVAPGSDGYGWDPERDLRLPMPELPGWVFEVVNGRAEMTPGPTNGACAEPVYGNGERNTKLTSLAGTMRKRGMPYEAIVAALGETNRLQCNPPLDAREVEKIARSVSRYDPKPDPGKVTKPEAPNDGWKVLTPEEIYAPLPPIEWAIEGMAPKGSLGMIVAPGSSLKSWLGTDLVDAAARGRLWLGRFLVSRDDAFYVDYEAGEYEMRRRLQRILAGTEPRGKYGPVSFVTMPSVLLTTEEEAFVGKLEPIAKKSAFIVVDSLSAGSAGIDENSPAFAQSLYALKRLAGRTGCTIVVIHHATKDDDRDLRMLVRGSGQIYNALDWCLVARRPDGRGPTTCHQIKGRSGDYVEPFVVHLADVSQEGSVLTASDLSDHNDKIASAVDKAKDKILKLLADRRDLKSRNAIFALIGGDKTVCLKAITELTTGETPQVQLRHGCFRLSGDVEG